MPHKPNLLVLMSDQHTPTVAGCHGNPRARTPQLDRLAAEGVTFDNAYCNNPVCVPSRMSMLTGLLSHRTGVWTNCHALPPHLATWPLLLRLCGYETVISGRNHLLWGDRMAGFARRLCGDEARAIPYIPPDSTLLGRRGPQGLDTQLGPCAHTVHADHDITASREAVRYLEAQDGTQPFALFVGLYQPHAPFVALPEFFAPAGQEPPPAPADEPLHDLYAPLHRRMQLDRGIEPRRLDLAVQAYYAMVTHVDALVGQVLDTLDARGLRDNTIVLYTSDHGEMLGRHRLWHKMTFYEDSVRVPMIFSNPARFGRNRRVHENVSLLDLFPTFLDFADSAEHPPLDGRSLRALLTGTSSPWDNRVIAESIGVVRGQPGRMLKRDHLKLLAYHGQPPALFDLQQDPGETTDVARDPRYAARLDALLREAMQDWEPEGINASIDQALEHIRFHHLASRL